MLLSSKMDCKASISHKFVDFSLHSQSSAGLRELMELVK